MQFIGYSILIALLPLAYRQQDNSLIDWRANYKLAWNDFKAIPDKNSPNAALTSTAIKIDFSYKNDELKYHISCRFDKYASWGRIKNEYILSHEQAHFDIAEIYARKLNKALKEYKPDPFTVKEDINKIYGRLMHAHHAMQVEYDEATNYSLNVIEQAKWLKKINERLNELKNYADYN